MQHLKKGYTILEVVVVISIIGILLSIISVGYWNFREKLEMEEAKISIITPIATYRDRAYHNHKSYTFLLDTNSRYIEVWEDGIGNRHERWSLPKKLRYRIPGKSGIVTKINPNGNLSNAFTLYIFGKSDRAQYRLGFYTFLQLRYLKINLYRNRDANGAIWGSIDRYHESSESKNLQGWEIVR
ncbi:MAG: prepilin-type N-terminal cleavage/methylation domain-containing protein [Fusobacteriaceae bacterium]